jgi:hypothetical protein
MSDKIEENHLSENHLSEDEIEIDDTEQKAVKSKQNSLELFEEFSKTLTALELLDSAFYEKEKQFEKDKKEYYSQRKIIIKSQEHELKKFSKSFKHDVLKATKPRKTGNSGKGGFNKEILVPKKLRVYLNIPEDKLMSRPQVTKLLNQKFIEDGFRSNKPVEGDDTTEVGNAKTLTISNKKVAKILGCEFNQVIPFNKFQGFIAKFYNEEKQEIAV